MSVTALFTLLAENPFSVLGLKPDCARAEAEREGQKLLSMLAVGMKEAATYSTPVGVFPRTPEKVRAAMAELREPTRRLFAELLAVTPVAAKKRAPPPPVVKWERAQVAFSLGRKRG